MHPDRLRWLVRNDHHTSLNGAIEIALGAPILLAHIDKMQKTLQALADDKTVPPHFQLIARDALGKEH